MKLAKQISCAGQVQSIQCTSLEPAWNKPQYSLKQILFPHLSTRVKALN